VHPGGDGTRALAKDTAHLDRLRDPHRQGTVPASVCTGSLVFAAAGLLQGRPATTHWNHVETLAKLDTTVEVRGNERYVDDGDVVTSAGVSAGIDMALEAAAEVRKGMRYARPFKTLQTYSDGKTVRWIEEAESGGDEPENPAPVLKLTAKGAEEAEGAAQDSASTASASATTKSSGSSTATASSSDSTARGLGIAGLVVGVLGLAAAVFAVVRSRSTGSRAE